MSTPTRGVSTPRIRTTGGEYFHEFEYQDWEEVDITKPIPIWICLLLVFGILFGGDFTFKSKLYIFNVQGKELDISKTLAVHDES